jgi:hypothetical protein
MDNLLIVDVPEGASKTEMYISEVKPIRTLDILCGLNPWNMEHKSISLPPGNWTIVEQTEKGAAKIVKRQRGGGKYYNYEIEGTSLGKYGCYHLNTAIESLHSWIRSQGKEPDEVVIIKKK